MVSTDFSKIEAFFTRNGLAQRTSHHMERQIGDSHWLEALREMTSHPSWTHIFVKGNQESRHAPLTAVKDSTWEYVVVRISKKKLAAQTYYMGKVVATTTYTYP